MGTVKNGVKWSGACINGEVIIGAAKGGNVFYRRGAYILLEYTDTSNIKHSEKFSDDHDLRVFIRRSTIIKEAKLTSVNGYKFSDSFDVFYENPTVEVVDLSNFDTSDITDWSYAFLRCQKLKSIILSNVSTNKVTTFLSAFSDCPELLSLDLTGFDVSNVVSTQNMFNGSSKLKTIYSNINWNNGKIENSIAMFRGCTSLVGAVAYDRYKDDINMANPTNGYFTRK